RAMKPENSAVAMFGLGIALCLLMPWLLSSIPTPGQLSSGELRDLDSNPSCRGDRLLSNTLQSLPAPDEHSCEVRPVKVIDKTDLVVLPRHTTPPLHYVVTIRLPSGLPEQLFLANDAFRAFNRVKVGETLQA